MTSTTPVSGTAGVTGGGADASDIHGLKTGSQHPDNATPAVADTGPNAASTVPATAGYSGKAYPGNTPQHTTGSNAASTVPATAGYSGGGATVSNEHGVATGKAYPGNTPQGPSTGTGAGTNAGSAAGTQSGQASSVIGAGADVPMSTVPVAGADTGNSQKPSAQDKARSKTAVLAAGVQEDLAKLREKLTIKDGVQAPAPGGAGSAPAGEYQPPTQTSFMDKAKAFAVKTIDHTQSALEGAKQNVTKQTTVPTQGGNTASTDTEATGTAGAGPATGTPTCAAGAPTSM